MQKRPTGPVVETDRRATYTHINCVSRGRFVWIFGVKVFRRERKFREVKGGERGQDVLLSTGLCRII